MRRYMEEDSEDADVEWTIKVLRAIEELTPAECQAVVYRARKYLNTKYAETLADCY